MLGSRACWKWRLRVTGEDGAFIVLILTLPNPVPSTNRVLETRCIASITTTIAVYATTVSPYPASSLPKPPYCPRHATTHSRHLLRAKTCCDWLLLSFVLLESGSTSPRVRSSLSVRTLRALRSFPFLVNMSGDCRSIFNRERCDRASSMTLSDHSYDPEFEGLAGLFAV